MCAAVEEQLGDSNFREIIDELFKEDEPMMETVKQHCDSFAVLYGECKQKRILLCNF